MISETGREDFPTGAFCAQTIFAVKTENINEIREEADDQQTNKEIENIISETEANHKDKAIKCFKDLINIKQIKLKLNIFAETNLGSNANKALLLMLLRKYNN